MFLDDHAAAVRTLRAGLESNPSSPRLRRSLSDAYVGWLESLHRKKSVSSTDDQRFLILDNALQHDPSDARLLLFLWRLIDEIDPKAADAMTIVRAMLALGRNVGLCHFILGTDAWKRDKPTEALVHLEAAYQANPSYPLIANNLAWVLAEGPNPDVPRALRLIDAALVANPKDPRFRGTRGHILAKLERWKEALPDLEASIAAFPDEPIVHERLTIVYSKLGLTDMAEQHRKWAEEKRRRREESKSKRPS
jgi:predicted Zn-dependent protease